MVDYPTSANFLMPLPAYPVKEVVLSEEFYTSNLYAFTFDFLSSYTDILFCSLPNWKMWVGFDPKAIWKMAIANWGSQIFSV